MLANKCCQLFVRVTLLTNAQIQSPQFLNKTYWSNGCYAVVDLLSWQQLVLLTGSDIMCKLLSIQYMTFGSCMHEVRYQPTTTSVLFCKITDMQTNGWTNRCLDVDCFSLFCTITCTWKFPYLHTCSLKTTVQHYC